MIGEIARYARCSDCDFRRSPRSAYKIAAACQISAIKFAKCARSRDFLGSSLRIASKVNQSGWAILSHDFSKSPLMEPGNKVEVPHRHIVVYIIPFLKATIKSQFVFLLKTMMTGKYFIVIDVINVNSDRDAVNVHP